MTESARYYYEVLLENGFELHSQTKKVRRFKNEKLGLPLTIEDLSDVFNVWVMPLDITSENLKGCQEKYEVNVGRNSNIHKIKDPILRKLYRDQPVAKFQVNTESQAVRCDFLRAVLAEYLRNAGSAAYSSLQEQTGAGSLRGEEKLTDYTDNPIKIAQTKVRTFQDKLRRSLLEKISKCELTTLEMPELLVASHIKPVKDCTEEEMQDLDNVLLLSPNMDSLFDRGFISFREDGYILLSPQISSFSRSRLGLSEDMRLLRHLTAKTKNYLKYHRENIFRKTLK
ncbi:HNH endonuclease [Parasutterella excrementihominis]|uniref:HNH endonuclease n=1 Tax=Parasutterella excrementihominis TaxID=487175 RepID=UPI0024B84B3C|nr:HNH endonuclease [Parasutterella excrementihominis]